MNHIILSGRLTADPEIKKTQSGMDVCTFTMAVTRPGSKKDDNMTDFFNCNVWGGKDGPGRAGAVHQYFHKGDGITVDGVMTTRKYQDKDSGKNLTAYNVQVDRFEFPITRRQDGAGQTAPLPVEDAEEVNTDELPF